MNELYANFLKTGSFDLEDFFISQIIEYAREHNLRDMPLTELRQILSHTWKKEVMGVFIRHIEKRGVLRYDKRRARVIVSLRERSNS